MAASSTPDSLKLPSFTTITAIQEPAPIITQYPDWSPSKSSIDPPIIPPIIDIFPRILFKHTIDYDEETKTRFDVSAKLHQLGTQRTQVLIHLEKWWTVSGAIEDCTVAMGKMELDYKSLSYLEMPSSIFDERSTDDQGFCARNAKDGILLFLTDMGRGHKINDPGAGEYNIMKMNRFMIRDTSSIQ